MLLDTHQVQQALEEYYGERLGRNIRITDLAYIQKSLVPRACAEVIEEKTGIEVCRFCA
jgi:hypothetical protein